MILRTLTEQLSLADQLSLEDVAEIVDQGFKTVICNRPDEEGEPHLNSAEAAQALAAAGIEFHYLPVNGAAISDLDVAEHKALLNQAQGPVLTYCRTGTRCAKLWALGSDAPADELIQQVANTGLNIEDFRDRLNG